VISRRQFLSGVGASILLSQFPIGLTLASNDRVDTSDFTIEKRVDATSLLDIVNSNHEYYTPGKEEIEKKYVPRCNSGYQNLRIETFDKELFPKFLVSFPNKNQGRIDGSLGNVTLLNNEGFLLTPHHCIEDYLKSPGKGEKWLIVFDPINKTVYTADILIHSEKYDLALGKLRTNKYNMFNQISNKKISIAKELPMKSNLVFCLKYRNIRSSKLVRHR